jgi:hypothetical protein
VKGLAETKQALQPDLDLLLAQVRTLSDSFAQRIETCGLASAQRLLVRGLFALESLVEGGDGLPGARELEFLGYCCEGTSLVTQDEARSSPARSSAIVRTLSSPGPFSAARAGGENRT